LWQEHSSLELECITQLLSTGNIARYPPYQRALSGKLLAIPQRLALRWNVGYALAGEEREEDIMTIVQSTSPFLDTVREAIRVRHYSIRTEDA